MDNSKEKMFYDSLGAVPQIPNGVFENIERAAVHTSAIRRGLIAACLCISLIIPAFVLTKIVAPAAYANDYEYMGELYYAFEYLNGELDVSEYDYLIDE